MTASVLLVEDDPGVRNATRVFLRITSKPIDADSLLGLMREMLPH